MSRRLSEAEIRMQVIGLLHRFSELGLQIDTGDAIAGIVGAASVRAVVGGVTEKQFKKLARIAYQHALLAEQLAKASATKIIVPSSATIQ